MTTDIVQIAYGVDDQVCLRRALSIYRNGDWAVTCEEVPPSAKTPSLSPSRHQLAVTHLPSGRGVTHHIDIYRAMLTCDAVAQTFAGIDAVKAPPVVRKAFMDEARRLVAERIAQAEAALEGRDTCFTGEFESEVG